LKKNTGAAREGQRKSRGGPDEEHETAWGGAGEGQMRDKRRPDEEQERARGGAGERQPERSSKAGLG